VYGVHLARKDAIRKLSVEQEAKALLAKYKYGKRSTAGKGQIGKVNQPVASKAKAVIRVKNGTYQAARLGSMRALASGKDATTSFGAGIRAGAQATARRSLNRAAGKAIGKPARQRKAAPKARTGRPAAKMKPVAQPASSKGAQRRSSGQASWMRGFLRLNDQGLTRNKRALLSPAQQEKAQAARRAYGTHNARKMSTRKLSDQQLAKAELAKYRFGRRSTAPTAPTGTRAKATIRLSSRSGQAARVAALKSRAAGNGAGVSFSQGLRSGERVRAQQSLNRAAGKAIGKPARQRKP
jgi:hypothetical protein